MGEYCDHDDDQNLLLDDDNVNKKQNCAKCKKGQKLFGKGAFAVNIHESTWVNRNGERTDIILRNSLSEEMLNINLDNVDTPLLVNPEDFHCHDKYKNSFDQKAFNKLVTVCMLCFLFMIIEFIGGYIAESLAVMTDAAHMFSDLIGFFVSILSLLIGRKAATRHVTFGYHRAEVIGAFISVLAVWLLAGIFFTLAVFRLWTQDFDINPNAMLIVASIGVAFNIVMGLLLHNVGHNHSHGEGGSRENINVRAAAAHVIGDLLQSVGVLIAAIIIKQNPNAKIADPICTLFFSIIVVCATLRVARDALKVLLESSPLPNSDLIMLLKALPGVRHVHEFHIWSLTPGKDAFMVHLAVDQGCDRDSLLAQATNLVKKKLNLIAHSIQIENYNEQSVEDCQQCQQSYL